MTGEEFVHLYATEPELRYRINKRAMHRAGGRIADAEDMVQAAWIRIMREPGGMPAVVYYAEACKGIHASYMRLWRQRGGGSPGGLHLSLLNPSVSLEAENRFREVETAEYCASLA